MADEERVLSQQEIDSLLKAINTGDVPAGRTAASRSDVVPLDFRRPQRLSRLQMRSLEAMHEPWAGALQDLLGAALRSAVDVKPAGAESMTFREYADSVPQVGAVVAAALEPAGATLLIHVDPAVSFAVVERMLGAGGPPSSPPGRPLREVEWKLLDRLIDRLLERLAACWSGIAVAALSVRARESTLTAIEGRYLNEGLVRLAFNVEGPGARGQIHLCLPVAVAERLAVRRAGTEAAPMAAGVLPEALAKAVVDVRARLSVEGMRLEDLKALSPGDVLHFSQSAEGAAVIEVGGLARLSARVGVLRGRRAVLVDGWLGAREARGATETREVSVRRRGAVRKGQAEGWAGALKAEVDIRAVIASREMKLQEILELRPGAVVGFPRRPGDLIVLEAGGRPFASGAAVRAGDRIAIQVAAVQEPARTVRSLG